MKVGLEVISWAMLLTLLVFVLSKAKAICRIANPTVIIELKLYLDIDCFLGKLCLTWLLFHNVCVNCYILGQNGWENQCK